ncbi:MAG: hypothetical protein LBD37_10785 [Treponema sp.]|jgi:hypothetical protein|nr:hypothetical protein [Treponema sp.]
MKQWIFGTAAAVMVFFAAGCDTPTGTGNKEDERENPPSGVDFTSHNTDYSILARNNTNERLAAFKGGLLADRLAGGIPARQ